MPDTIAFHAMTNHALADPGNSGPRASVVADASYWVVIAFWGRTDHAAWISAETTLWPRATAATDVLRARPTATVVRRTGAILPLSVPALVHRLLASAWRTVT